MRRASRAARTVGRQDVTWPVGPPDVADQLARQVEEALADAAPVDATPSLVVGLVLAGLPVLLTLFMVLTTVF